MNKPALVENTLLNKYPMLFTPVPINREEMIEIASSDELQTRWKTNTRSLMRMLIKNPGVKFTAINADCYWKELFVIVPGSEDPFVIQGCCLVRERDGKISFEC